MSNFSSLLSSIGGQSYTPQQPITKAPKPCHTQQQAQRPGNGPNGAKPMADSASAGMKRKAQDAGPEAKAKTARTDQRPPTAGTASAAPSRFQLSKSSPAAKSAAAPVRPGIAKSASSSTLQKPGPSITPKTATAPSSGPGADGAGAPKKSRYASILEKAKAAEEAAKAGPSGIKHRPVEKLTRKERLRLQEKQKAQQRPGARPGAQGASAAGTEDRSRSGTPNGSMAGGPKKKTQELSYKGTMKKPPEPLSYKGTMRPDEKGAPKQPEKKKGQAQDKYGGYASWSDLDEAEDEEDDYGSESDMEGGFDDVEEEEQLALRAARKEDQEALAEEERLKKEKMLRKQKLQQLSKSAAGRKKVW